MVEEKKIFVGLGAYAFILLVGLIILAVYGYSLLEVFSVALNAALVLISVLMIWATLKSAEATRKVGDLGFKPLMIAYIRPASHYFTRKGAIRSWKEGVGIYVENLGAGPAVNGKIMCKVTEEKEERIYKMFFQRMTPGTQYTYPAVGQPNLLIKETDQKLEVRIEYDDALRKHHTEEPVVIEIEQE